MYYETPDVKTCQKHDIMAVLLLIAHAIIFYTTGFSLME